MAMTLLNENDNLILADKTATVKVVIGRQRNATMGVRLARTFRLGV